MNHLIRGYSVRHSKLLSTGKQGAVLIILAMISLPAMAHVRWFVDAKTVNPATYIVASEKPGFMSLWFVGGAVAYCAFCVWGNRRKVLGVDISGRNWFVSEELQKKVLQLLSLATGVTLAFASYEGIVLAPNLNQGPMEMIGFQCFVALLLSVGAWSEGVAKISGGLLLFFVGWIATVYSLELWMDYSFEFSAIGVALVLMARPAKAAKILRWGFGIQLIVLAIHNKLWQPGLGLGFLHDHNWNFLAPLGARDVDFVVAAGLAELSFGLTILLGQSLRFSVCSVSFFFLFTAFLLGPHELVGHLPILAMALALLVLPQGDGGKANNAVSRVQAKAPDIRGSTSLSR